MAGLLFINSRCARGVAVVIHILVLSVVVLGVDFLSLTLFSDFFLPGIYVSDAKRQVGGRAGRDPGEDGGEEKGNRVNNKC